MINGQSTKASNNNEYPSPPRKAPTRQLHSNTHCCLWSGPTRKQSNSLALSSINKKVGTRCRSPSDERFLEGCSSPFMRLAEHLTALSRLVQATSAWVVKTRRALSRHSRNARVYRHTTTAMNKLSTPPPPKPQRQRQPQPPRPSPYHAGSGSIAEWS